ncbi:putative transmembrane sensor domain protein [Halobacteroides halobius DSM 5150]|uniref:Putative transmembrane sensor domain protein n=1 Tax=Halobacteroides halobius (strain ATCC 35273 / DSM 5150 / MD-1) TaxID=748449 RepID=L0K8F8_HALHC|nr:adenylate/guanylate cyclase domain-containing protein [Halobacteroides halobius]AGB41281.1 putative transmembrane sensor domain protein [Halobacteroides halobius DSM 5150]
MLKQKSWLILGLIIGIVITVIFASGLLKDLELVTYDYRLLFKSLFTVNRQDKIVIVKIDQFSLDKLGGWPWPRRYHAQLIKILNQAGAKLIGFDILFDLPSTAKEDQQLKKAVSKAQNVFLPSTLDLQVVKTLTDEEINIQQINTPLTKFKRVAAGGGYLNLLPDRDGKIRRLTIINTKKISPFSINLARSYNNVSIDLKKQDLLINFHYQTDYFKQISYSKVLNGNFTTGTFKDKIVLIGATDDALQDYLMTPLALIKGFIPGIIVQAEIIDNYLQDSFIHKLSLVNTSILVLLSSLILAYLYKMLSPFTGIILTIVALILIVIISCWGLINFNLFIPLIPFILVTILNLIFNNLVAYLQIEKRKDRLQTVFARYLAPEVIERMVNLSDKDYLKGERREISVLFVDLVGFTNFAENKTSDQVVNVLNRYFAVITEECFKLDGTLDKFLGDGAMIFFGAPTQQNDHANKAVQLALNIQEKIENNPEFPLRVTIGINTGLALVGNIGSKKRSDYTAIGDVVNTAARIETEAKTNQILIGEETYHTIKNKFLVQKKAKVKVKGKEKEVKIYQVIKEES